MTSSTRNMLTVALFALAAMLGNVAAHGNHAYVSARATPPAASDPPRRPRIELPPDADWATRHMAEEHHISSFDAASFFMLHDFDSNGFWDTSEMLKLYGLEHESNVAINTESRRHELSTRLLGLLDADHDGLVSRAEYIAFTTPTAGSDSPANTLPDLGTGPGHHWDMEMEYEIHHWELYHDENTRLEDLTHPEDEEHFRLHDQLEDEAEQVEAQDRLRIVEKNIPSKFRRSG